ncbi:MAG: biopolymer transporter ExbD [Akkermansiaceae bacterium]|nr:biopolymer transporter ExbD [Akkermansiaceae bacterium]
MAKKNRAENSELNIGFQIAPMIDVVFVIMLFFMVMAGQVQVEQELNLKLPGTIQSEHEATDVVEETQIRVLETGDVLLNEEQIGNADDARLNELAGTLRKLNEAAEASKSKVVVTIMADEYAQYQRVVDVLNALSAARIKNVTFEVPPQ